MSDTEDDDVKRAIALSMEEPSPSSRIETPIAISDTEDEDVKRAILLSMEQPTPSPKDKAKIVIDLLSDDDDDGDDDLDAPVTTRRFIEVNKAKIDDQGSIQNSVHSNSKIPTGGLSQSSSFQTISTTSTSTPVGTIKVESAPPSSTLSIQGQTKMEEPQLAQSVASSSVLGSMNRRQMEQERLARAEIRKKLEEEKLKSSGDSKKRKEPYSPPQQDHSKRQNKSKTTVNSTSTLHHTKAIPIPGIRSKDTKGITSPLPAAQQPETVISYKEHQRTVGASGIQYPDGVVKKTWAYGYPRQGDDIKIEEILQKDDLEFALLSSYLIDPEWVMSKLDDKTKVIMVLHSKDEKEKQALRLGSDKNYGFCFPSLEGQINCMHSKLQLLAHSAHLRVVVPSANLMPYDWGETGIMENICFLIDLPRLPDGQTTEPTTPFGTELVYFLQAQGLGPGVISSISKFDFSRTEHLAFVHTIGGSHSGSARKRTGYCGLGTAVQKLGLQTDEALNIDFVAASIGNITENFIKCMVLAAKGDDGSTEYGWRTDKPSSRGKVVSETERKLSDEVKNRCRIYFPTRDTIARSRGGVANGGTICLQSKWFDAATFPRSLVRDCKSVRAGLLMHNKITFVRPENPNGRAWAYVGSANLSESAWGHLSKDKTTKQPKLNCRNWECGVIFQVLAPATSSAARHQGPVKEASDRGDESISMDIFQGHVPVPMVVPGDVYGARRPWFFSE